MDNLLPKKLNKKNDANAYKAVEDLINVLREAREEGIRNIALAGPFGAGKSSVLRTLREDFKEERTYLTISLTTLQSDNPENKRGQKPTVNEGKDEAVFNFSGINQREEIQRKIEYSILQQLIYREKASELPRSRIKRLNHISKGKLARYAIAVILLILSWAVAFEPKFLRVDTFYEFLDFGKYNVFGDFLAILYILFFLGWLLFTLMQNYQMPKVNKLNIKEGEIDLEENTSVFNKHLDEILYFFAATKYDTVLIEDLDRYEDATIYLKLRELNQLINESKDVNRNIVFVYAVKDDIFINEDRTKFFDYIITVIPVINPSNSRDILKFKLGTLGIKDKEISDEVISEVSFFINDMRILTNIVQEFKQYRDRLISDNNQLNLSKLLAMIIYKNYYPNDFGLLHRREGKIYDCISHKLEFIEKISHDIKLQKDNLLKERKTYENKLKLEVNQLRRFFIYEEFEKHVREIPIFIEINGGLRNMDILTSDDELFNKFLSSQRIEYRTTSDTYYNKTANLQIGKLYSDSKYKKIIDGFQTGILAEIDNKIESLNKKIQDIAGLPFSQILTFKEVRNSQEFNELHLSDLMVVFLLNGLIDEDYYDYISYFYPGMLSPADRSYLMNIKLLKDPIYGQHIDNIEFFIKELRLSNFRTNSILNVEVLDYLLENKNRKNIKDFLNQIINQIIKDEFSLDFLSYYFINSKCNDKFFPMFLQNRAATLWGRLDTCVAVNEKIYPLRESILRFSSGLTDRMIDWCNKNYDFLESRCENIEDQRLDEIVERSTFKKIGCKNRKLLNLTIHNNSYEINRSNVLIVLKESYNRPDLDEESLSLDLIRESTPCCIGDYLLKEENLPALLVCLSFTQKNESIQSIELVINSNADEEIKKRFLEGQNTKRKDAKGLDDVAAKLLYEANLIQASWSNVSDLFSRFNTEQGLVARYVEENCNSLAIKESAKGINEKDDIFDFLFGNNSTLSISTYEKLLPAFDIAFNGDELLLTLEIERLKLLLSSGYLPCTEENISTLQSSEHFIPFFLHHKKKFIPQPKYSVDWNARVLFELIRSSDLLEEEKFNLINNIAFNKLLENNDLMALVSGIISKRIGEVNFSLGELEKFLSSTSKVESRIIILNFILENSVDLSKSEISRLLLLFHEEEFNQLAERQKKPKFPSTASVLSLMNNLKQLGFISSYTEDKGCVRPNYFRNQQ